MSNTDPPLLVHDQEGGRDAALFGFLTYLEEPNCFVLEGERGNASTVATPVWRKGTVPFRRDGKVAGIEVPDFGEIRIGMRVSAGGGQLPKGTKFPTPPAECYRGEDHLYVIDQVVRVD